jgi:phosphotransferase system HPr-like phosphotransfer protein
MTLAAEQGAVLKLKFDGVDEQQLCDDMISFFERGFDEM